MPKQKTHTGAKKRFRLTAKGKVKFKHAKMRHIQEHMSKGTKATLRKGSIMNESDARHVRSLLGKG
ncbi:MAG: 50S ribosomal protein L35 [Oligoflexia bacterium]|nr:50S ribosomal protein L35 [Oligoflexia bacterium]